MARKNKNKEAATVKEAKVNATKYAKATDTVKQVAILDGVYEAVFTHKTKDSTCDFTYSGPKISRAAWEEVVAFCQYSQRTTHSEAQLRLFCNPRLGVWKAWAFPQICGTGMTTKEIEDETPERTAQRAQFKDSEGWIPMGTVHHHCSAGAFQSGTDANDEAIQDGLHITLGNIGQDKHSIDCRFYVRGNKLDPDMSLFFDVSEKMEAANSQPYFVRAFYPKDFANQIARDEMCDPVDNDEAFPVEWKANLIERRVTVSHPSAGRYASTPYAQSSYFAGYAGGYTSGGWDKFPRYELDNKTLYRSDTHGRVSINNEIDFNRALQSLKAFLKHEFASSKEVPPLVEQDVLDLVEDIDTTLRLSAWPMEDVLATLYLNDCQLEPFVKWLREKLEKEGNKSTATTPTSGNGAPPVAKQSEMTMDEFNQIRRQIDAEDAAFSGGMMD